MVLLTDIAILLGLFIMLFFAIFLGVTEIYNFFRLRSIDEIQVNKTISISNRLEYAESTIDRLEAKIDDLELKFSTLEVKLDKVLECMEHIKEKENSQQP